MPEYDPPMPIYPVMDVPNMASIPAIAAWEGLLPHVEGTVFRL